MEGEIYDGRKRKLNSSDDDADVVETSSKKKIKKKQKPDQNHIPGKYVLLQPQDDCNVLDEVGSSEIRNVSHVFYSNTLHT